MEVCPNGIPISIPVMVSVRSVFGCNVMTHPLKRYGDVPGKGIGELWTDDDDSHWHQPLGAGYRPLAHLREPEISENPEF